MGPPRLQAVTRQNRCFAHHAVEDRHGVIVPWCHGQNGQRNLRVHIAAEAMKHYPRTTPDRAVGIAPEYTFNSGWRIAQDGTITIPSTNNWMRGDGEQMGARALPTRGVYHRNGLLKSRPAPDDDLHQ